MLRLIRWLLLGSFLASLLAVCVAFRLHGHTIAEVACKLAESKTCESWAQRCAATVRRTLELFDYPEHHTSAPVRVDKVVPEHGASPRVEGSHPSASAQPGNAVVTTPADGAPLDQHTPQNRRDLDHILSTRGSR